MSPPLTVVPEDLAREDLLCAFGPRRPDWTRTGAPSLRELAVMKALRARALEGYIMISCPYYPVEPKQDKRQTPPSKQPRPVGMPDDHPLILSGVYL